MSDFAKAFALFADGDPDIERTQTAYLMQQHNVSADVAAILIETARRGMRDTYQAMGACIDSTAPDFQPELMQYLLGLVRVNLPVLQEVIISTIMGERPTPDCDCEPCKVRTALLEQLRNVEAQIHERRVH